MKMWRKFGKRENLASRALKGDLQADRTLVKLLHSQTNIAFRNEPGVSIQAATLLGRASTGVVPAHEYIEPEAKPRAPVGRVITQREISLGRHLKRHGVRNYQKRIEAVAHSVAIFGDAQSA
jgi:hypothetical protein